MTGRTLLLFVVAAFVAVASGGCKKEETPGERLDKGLEKAGEAVEKGGKEMQGK